MCGCITEKETKREIINIAYAKRGLLRNKHPIYTTEEIIKKAVEEHGDHLSIGWSGGKCSTVALHLALKVKPDIIVHYNNTGVEFPENVTYCHAVAKQWKLNFFELKPSVNFWQDIVAKYGMPKPRCKVYGRRKNQIGFDKNKRPLCCTLLKEEPVKKFYAEHKITGEIYGLRAAESRQRGIFVGQRGLIYQRKSVFPLTLYMPIALWYQKEIDEYIKNNNIPHNPVYDTQTRNGCWPCTSYLKWQENLQKYSPKMYKFLMEKKMGEMLISSYVEKGEC